MALLRLVWSRRSFGRSLLLNKGLMSQCTKAPETGPSPHNKGSSSCQKRK